MPFVYRHTHEKFGERYLSEESDSDDDALHGHGDEVKWIMRVRFTVQNSLFLNKILSKL
jgi:hypothetical protein